MKKKIISLFLAVVMIVGMIPLSAMPVFAETDGESRLMVANSTEGQTIGTSGAVSYYYVDTNTNCTSTQAIPVSGLSIAEGATVHLVIAKGATLTCRGGNAWHIYGAGAGILVPKTSTLYLEGEGKLVAIGGAAGNGENGGNARNSDVNIEWGTFDVHGGAGGSGGTGGGGAGAGIGTAGGNPGYGGGGGSAAYAYNYYKEVDALDHGAGGNGKNGEKAAEMGTLYVESSLTLFVNGGVPGTSGEGGAAGGTWYVNKPEVEEFPHYYSAAGGGGGGGGCGGGKGADIGTGGQGGGGGGGGAGGGVVCKKRHGYYSVYSMGGLGANTFQGLIFPDIFENVGGNGGNAGYSPVNDWGVYKDYTIHMPATGGEGGASGVEKYDISHNRYILNSSNGQPIGETGKTMYYYVSGNTTCTSSKSGIAGITIAEGAIVHIVVPKGTTLTCKGGNGKDIRGGGAGILLPESSELYLEGGGTVKATGGNAAQGGYGGQGESADILEDNFVADLFTWEDGEYYGGDGGNGGNGGGGAGAGIGTNGGFGGQGGYGGSGQGGDIDEDHINYNDQLGGKGNDGNFALPMGTIHLDVTLVAAGGTRGAGGGTPPIGGYGNFGYYTDWDNNHSSGGGGNGGGGQGGGAGATVGTGGQGGGGGAGGVGGGAIYHSSDGFYDVYSPGGYGGGFDGKNYANADRSTVGATGTSSYHPYSDCVGSWSGYPNFPSSAGGFGGADSVHTHTYVCEDGTDIAVCSLCGAKRDAYIDRSWDEQTHQIVSRRVVLPDTVKKITASTTELTSGWYVLSENVTIPDNNNLKINGDVHLVLYDGCELNIPNPGEKNPGILLSKGNSLTVYGRLKGTGSIVTYGDFGGENYGGAGIGGGFTEDGGTLNVCGGIITAYGGSYASAIGAGFGGSGGEFNMYGGSVVAENIGLVDGAGIGSGFWVEKYDSSGYEPLEIDGGKINIYGGTVSATGKGAGPGIGGTACAGGEFNMYGGAVTATSGSGFVGAIGNGVRLTDDYQLVRVEGGSVTVHPQNGNVFYVLRNGDDINGSPFSEQAEIIDLLAVTSIPSGDDVFTPQVVEITTHTHDFSGAYRDNGDGTHICKCTQCEEWSEPVAHTFIDEVCACGAEEFHVHDFSGDYVDNGNGTHSRKCLGCTVTGNTNVHTFVNHICDCGAISDHNFVGDYVDNGNGTHSRKCTECDAVNNSELHTFVNHICDCGTISDHNFAGDYVDNGDGTHSRKCTECEELDTPEAHTHINSTCVCGTKSYIDRSWDETKKQVISTEKAIPKTAQKITADTRELTSGWYVLSESVTLPERAYITVNGDVNLVLCDGCELKISSSGSTHAAIELTDGGFLGTSDSLTVYGQQGGTGSIVATGGSEAAGIGSDVENDCGDIKIYGGTVTATGGMKGAGIGGGYKGDCGDIKIYGGTVTATGGDRGAGIGNGYGGNGGSITVYGGSVTANGNNGGMALGGGSSGIYRNKISIYGGDILADSKSSNDAVIADSVKVYADSHNQFTVKDSNGTELFSPVAEEKDIYKSLAGNRVLHIESQPVHTFDEYVDNDDGTHTGICTKCGELSEPEAHTFVNHECVCGAANEHSFTGEYKNNGDGTHSRKCTGCDDYGTPEAHTFVNHTCICGAHNDHDFTGEYKDNGDGTHSRKCTECDEYGATEAHTFVNHKCVCGATNEHDFTENCLDNGDGTHTGICTECGEIRESEAHVYVNGVCCCGRIEKYVTRSWDDTEKKVVSSETDVPLNAVKITKNTTELGGGWYYLAENIETSNRIVIKGTTENPTNIILPDGITLEATNGIELAENNVLNIYGQKNDTGKIDTQSDNDNAAIGGNSGDDIGENGGTLTVYGGTVEATAEFSAGIGGGDGVKKGGNGGTVTVFGGTVTATSANGAGIGGGGSEEKGGNGGTVTVFGGTVTATSINGAGIGGGVGYEIGGDGGEVVINGGTVTAESEYGAGIGGGMGDKEEGIGGGDGATVIVNGGEVTAESELGAGIGGGLGIEVGGNGGTVTVNGGSVTATSVDGAGIGGGAGEEKGGDGGDVTVNDGTVTAESEYGAGIGGGDGIKKGGDGGTVTVNDGEVTATSELGAGIGGGYGIEVGGNGGTLTVFDGTVTAESGAGAGIGGGCGEEKGGNGGEVTVNGGTVTATSVEGAGIGGGAGYDGGSGGTLTVFDGTVTAESTYGAGIGGGAGYDGGDGGEVTVNGGSVTATSVEGAGIGGGEGYCGGDGGTLTVYGGTVTAESELGAGIGGGYAYEVGGNGGTVTVNGGSVTAYSDIGAGIGGGLNCENHGTLTVADGSVIKAGDTADTADETTVEQYKIDRNHYVSVAAPHIHNFTGEYKDNGDGTHSRKCTGCDEYGATEVHTFVNHKCVCGATNEHVFFTGISLTLDSEIFINFYMELTEDAVKNGNMVFTVGNRTVKSEVKLNEDNGRYYFTCPLNALEMAEDVTATFTYCDRIYEMTYSVEKYVDTILAGSYSDEMKNLARKIANYGYYAQIYLDGIHTNVTIGEGGYAEMEHFGGEFDIDVEKAKAELKDEFIAPAKANGTSLYGRTAYLDSAIALNYYVTVDNGKEPTVVCNDKRVEIEKYKNSIYIVSIKDITATELAEKFTVTINGVEFTGSVFDYCGAVITNNPDNSNAAKAMAALYEYYDAAVKYADSKKN